MQTTVHESFPPAEALMRDVLRDGAPIAPEYPLVFDEAFAGRVVTAQEDRGGARELRSACAILARDLILPGARLRVGFIGSVVTHPSHRRGGWGREVLARAEEALRGEGCACSMLWADDPGFYEHLGYAPVGTELHYLIDPCLSAVLPSMQRVREGRPDDFAALLRLYTAKPERVERSQEEMSALLSIPEMELLVREDEGRGARGLLVRRAGRGLPFRDPRVGWRSRGRARDGPGPLAAPPRDG